MKFHLFIYYDIVQIIQQTSIVLKHKYVLNNAIGKICVLKTQKLRKLRNVRNSLSVSTQKVTSLDHVIIDVCGGFRLAV